MGAKIMVGAVEITVPVTELGEAMKQLAPWLEVKVPNGDLAAPVKKAGWLLPTGDTPPPLAAPRSAVQGSLPLDPNLAMPRLENLDTRSRALLLFKALRDHRASGGVRPEEVMALVGASHPKGIGSRMKSINGLLRDCGFDHEDVYRNDRNEVGMRMWTPSTQVAEAISALEKLSPSTA